MAAIIFAYQRTKGETYQWDMVIHFMNIWLKL